MPNKFRQYFFHNLRPIYFDNMILTSQINFNCIVTKYYNYFNIWCIKRLLEAIWVRFSSL